LPQYLESLVRSSASIIQWREGDLGLPGIRELIREGAALARENGKLFLVNNNLELALEEGADGIHLSSDKDLAEILDRTGNRGREFVIGKSAHSIEEAVSAEAEGADYITLSPIYEPFSKETDHGLLGLNTLRNAAQTLAIPVFALGGVGLSRLEVITAAGAAGIAGTTWIHEELTETGLF